MKILFEKLASSSELRASNMHLDFKQYSKWFEPVGNM